MYLADLLFSRFGAIVSFGALVVLALCYFIVVLIRSTRTSANVLKHLAGIALAMLVVIIVSFEALLVGSLTVHPGPASDVSYPWWLRVGSSIAALILEPIHRGGWVTLLIYGLSTYIVFFLIVLSPTNRNASKTCK